MVASSDSPTIDLSPRRAMPTWMVGLILFLVCLGSRAVTIHPGHGGILWNTDELMMVWGVTDGYLGVPCDTLRWPTGIAYMLSMAAFSAVYGIRVHGHASATSFVTFLQNCYIDPMPLVMLVRWLVAAGFSVGVAAVGMAAHRLTRRAMASMLIALAVMTVPQLWLLSHTATPHAFGFGLACVAAFLLVPAKGPAGLGRWLAAGMLCGLAISAHFTLLAVTPAVLALGLQYAATDRLRKFLFFCFGCMTAALLACPYVWTEPLRLAKAVISNVASLPGQPKGLAGGFLFIGATLYPAVAAMLVLGLLGCIVNRRWWLVVGALVSIAMMANSACRAPAVLARYIVPMALVAAALAASGLRPQAATNGNAPRTRAGLAATVVFSLAIAAAIIFYLRMRPQADFDWPLSPVASTLHDMPDGARVIIPEGLEYRILDRTSSESFARDARNCRQPLEWTLPGSYPIMNNPQIKHIVTHIPWSFTEREQAFIARMQLRGQMDRPGLDVTLWAPEDVRQRFGFLTASQAIQSFLDGKTDALVIDEPIPGHTPNATYANGWLFFKR